jgi:hypothetical protein
MRIWSQSEPYGADRSGSLDYYRRQVVSELQQGREEDLVGVDSEVR